MRYELKDLFRFLTLVNVGSLISQTTFPEETEIEKKKQKMFPNN